jgi:hypothetical protein
MDNRINKQLKIYETFHIIHYSKSGVKKYCIFQMNAIYLHMLYKAYG